MSWKNIIKKAENIEEKIDNVIDECESLQRHDGDKGYDSHSIISTTLDELKPQIVEKDYQELGIYVRKGEVYQLQTKEQKDEFRLLLSNFTRSINPVLNKPIKKELS